MKKRMFLSTFLMTLVLLLAVTTATFAWYTASVAGEAAGPEAIRQDIGTADNTYNSGDLTFTVTFGTEDLSGIIPTDSVGDVYYIPYEGASYDEWIKDTNASSSEERCKVVKVTLTVSGGTGDVTLDALLEAISKETYTVTVTPGENVKVSFEGVSEAYAATSEASFEVTGAQLLAAKDNNYSISCDLYVAVHGGSKTNNKGVSEPVDNLTLSAQVSGGNIGN